MSIRMPAVSGRFYPGDEDLLKKELQQYFKGASSAKGVSPAALIVPHAGYVFSGNVAAEAFNSIPSEKKYRRVFILGGSHTLHFEGASVYADEGYKTPLGVLKTDSEVVGKLMETCEALSYIPLAHKQEHSLEVQMPFIQYQLGNDIPIVPVLLGDVSREEIKDIAAALEPYFNEENLFVVSTDFSHFPAYDDAGEQDNLTAEAIVSNDPDILWQRLQQVKKQKIPGMATPLCGWTAVMTLLEITAKKAVKYQLLQYRNSGDSRYGNKHEVVGYYAISVERQQNNDELFLTDNQKDILLAHARKSLYSYLTKSTRPAVDTENLPENLKVPCGAFVSLYNGDELRGCVGNLQGNKPLYEIVGDMTLSAATGDYRFSDITIEELPDISVEISVLTPLKRLGHIEELEPGKHGVYVKSGLKSGTLLPQVATKMNWTKEELLGHCSRDKAGLEWDGWKQAEVYTYKAIVFDDKGGGYARG